MNLNRFLLLNLLNERLPHNHHHASQFLFSDIQLLQSPQFMLLNHVFLNFHHDCNTCIWVLWSEFTTTIPLRWEFTICNCVMTSILLHIKLSGNKFCITHTTFQPQDKNDNLDEINTPTVSTREEVISLAPAQIIISYLSDRK